MLPKKHEQIRKIANNIIKAEACDRQHELLSQLLEQLDKEGSPGILKNSIFHKAIEKAVLTGTVFYRIGKELTK